MKRAAIFAAAIVIQTATAQAHDHKFSAHAEFNFDGAEIIIEPRFAGAASYASAFATLAPECNPYCIVPQVAAVGIETIVETDVLEFLVTGVGKNNGLLVDARMPDARAMGFIPGSVSLPHQTVALDNELRDEILKALGARAFEDVFNFADAQNLVVYDNGPTQNDAGKLISRLLEAGYPSEKIRYYRGGMQVWSVVGLTIQE